MDISSDKQAKSHMKNLDMAKKMKPFERNWISSDSSKNNAIRISYVKARIDKMQQNSRYWLCGDRDEIINHMISKCSKLVQKEYKTRVLYSVNYDWIMQETESWLWIMQETELWLWIIQETELWL